VLFVHFEIGVSKHSKSAYMTNGALQEFSKFLDSMNALSVGGMQGLHVVISAHPLSKWLSNLACEAKP
jgi:hypothetical protein